MKARSFIREYCTELYKGILGKMKPIMEHELKNANDPVYLIKATMKALNKKKPKARYRVKNSGMLRMLEIFPHQLLDWAYKVFLS